jgi:RPA family protein
MKQREPNLVISSLSQSVSVSGVKIQVNIIRLENETAWTLEVVNARGTSTVWNDQFPTDDAAFEEFKRTLNTEGIESFLDQGNVVPFKR